MTHLIICREYPPAAYPPGGIGTYVQHISTLLARAGEQVHVIAHRWEGAPSACATLEGGRLVVHRVALDEAPRLSDIGRHAALAAPALLASSFPAQAFAWQAALLAERLVVDAGIDVIEAQEWEAPLYYLQLRRRLGLGPARRPPCLVHLHSPTERIFAANRWETTVTDFAPAAALEAGSIAMADAVLCPSWFIAHEAIARYAIDPERVTVIPYPLGPGRAIERRPEVWATGSIVHVGRLEPRKGVLEWAEAIARVAPEHPQLRFDFVGGDIPLHATGGPSVGASMRARVPRALRQRMRFHGVRDRDGVAAVLATAFASVVPSRWENFPYSCIESMRSGVPVLASPNGGMREMIEDGVSGWIAPDATPDGLARTLRRVLETPAAERQRMGAAATAAVERLCDSATIVGRHLDLKARLARDLGSREATRPVPGASGVSASSPSSTVARRGLGVVVVGRDDGASPERCLAAIRDQVSASVAVTTTSPPGAVFAAAGDIVRQDPSLAGVVIVDARVCLEPDCTATCETLFARDDRLGLLTCWVYEAGRRRIHVPPQPTNPLEWGSGNPVPFLALRRDVLLAMPPGEPTLALAELSAGGWTAVTYPGVLASIPEDRRGVISRTRGAQYSSMARAIQRLHTPLLELLLTSDPRDSWALAVEGLRHPGRAVRWLAGRARPAPPAAGGPGRVGSANGVKDAGPAR